MAGGGEERGVSSIVDLGPARGRLLARAGRAVGRGEGRKERFDDLDGGGRGDPVYRLCSWTDPLCVAISNGGSRRRPGERAFVAPALRG
jgi:hypothetical protein